MNWQYIVGILVISGMVGLYFLLSRYREKRVWKSTVPFCEAFINLCDHALKGRDFGTGVRVSGSDESMRLRPIEDQPEAVQALLNEQIDDYLIEQYRNMEQYRDEAQLLLSAHTLIANRYNTVLNYSCQLAEALLLAMKDPSALKGKKQIDLLNAVLLHQKKFRSDMLPSILPKPAKQSDGHPEKT